MFGKRSADAETPAAAPRAPAPAPVATAAPPPKAAAPIATRPLAPGEAARGRVSASRRLIDPFGM